MVKARANDRYLPCPHCERRHISKKNIELCRKIQSNYKFLEDWGNRNPKGIFYNEVSYLMWDRIMISIRKCFNLICTKCHNKTGTPEVHHIIPRSKGGTDHPSNLTLLCLSCHHLVHSKRDLGNYQLTSFTPQCFDSKGDKVSYEEYKRQQLARLKEVRQQLARRPEKKKKGNKT